jgi:hypothetical protein
VNVVVLLWYYNAEEVLTMKLEETCRIIECC